jgi:TPR repeat protein
VRAQAGDAYAQYALGLRLAAGDRVTQNHVEAHYWFDRAAAASLVDAAYCLGLDYERGRGVNSDVSRALQWYSTAAEAGHAEAQCNLGALLMRDQTRMHNAVDAAFWLVQSVARGNTVAAKNLQWLLRERPILSTDDRSDLRSFVDKAKAGERNALLFMGWVHETGFGTAVDLHEARRYYLDAQRRGHLFAHALLSRLNESR